jgi:hypothetical protein
MRVRGADDAQACVLPLGLAADHIEVLTDEGSETALVSWFFNGNRPAQWRVSYRNRLRGVATVVTLSGLLDDHTFDCVGVLQTDTVQIEVLASDSCGRFRPIGLDWDNNTQ